MATPKASSEASEPPSSPRPSTTKSETVKTSTNSNPYTFFLIEVFGGHRLRFISVNWQPQPFSCFHEIPVKKKTCWRNLICSMQCNRNACWILGYDRYPISNRQCRQHHLRSQKQSRYWSSHFKCWSYRLFSINQEYQSTLGRRLLRSIQRCAHRYSCWTLFHALFGRINEERRWRFANHDWSSKYIQITKAWIHPNLFKKTLAGRFLWVLSRQVESYLQRNDGVTRQILSWFQNHPSYLQLHW